MAQVELKGVSKVYGGIRAVDSVDLVIDDQEFVVLVGPSGCGKSTTLRMICGLEDISEGELSIDGELMNDVQPKDRNIAMVFQNYALYPHMTVYENMAFSLRMKKVPGPEIDARVQEAARILDIVSYLDRRPKALSGGQRQRVAVGRAIVRQPKVFLFDEPLSNLDAKLRVQMRGEIIALHNRLKATIVYVTHDQVEAMTMGSKIVVMKDGVVQQIGPPLHLYHHPVNKFVAGFIGSPPMNFLKATVVGGDSGIGIDDGMVAHAPPAAHLPHLKEYAGEKIIIGIRPEDFRLVDGGSGEPAYDAEVTVAEPLGAETILHLRLSGGQDITAKVPPAHQFQYGDAVRLAVSSDRLKYFDSVTERAILPDP